MCYRYVVKMSLRGWLKSIIIFPLDFLYLCAILSQTMWRHTGCVKRAQGHSSTVEYRSPKPRMRVRFLLPLPDSKSDVFVFLDFGSAIFIVVVKLRNYRQFFMKKILDFFKSVRSEWFKIVWPSRDSVIRATIMILVFSGLAALFFFVVDSILNAIVGWVF